MTKKSKHMTGKAFPVEICDAIRHHQGEITALESRRKNAFEDRDAAVAEKNGLRNRDGKEYLEASRRHSDAVVLIQTLDDEIKWHRGQLREVIEDVDNPQLEITFDPPPAAPKEDAGQMTIGDVGTRPVGRPGKTRPEAPDPSKGDGVDEHLAASVNELDCRENLKGKLIEAGLTTVGRVVAAIEDRDKDLRDVLDCGENIASEIKKAVKVFRTRHRTAAMEAENDGATVSGVGTGVGVVDAGPTAGAAKKPGAKKAGGRR